MTRFLTLAALTAGLLAASAPGAQAQYRSPAASLGGSCQTIQTLQTGYVTAECRDDQGRYRWSSIYAPQCRSELINRNGVLACQGATGNAGGYVSQPTSQGSTAANVIGAIAQALLGVDNDPVWGQPGDQDPNQSYGRPGWDYGTTGQWVPIASRKAWLEDRLATGQWDRSLSRQDATRLRSEFQAIARLEVQYRRGGLSNTEQADLDRRFDALSARLPGVRQNGPYGWQGLTERQAEVDARIDAALRDRALSVRDAAQLRADFQAIVRLESQYQQRGMTNAQQTDLNRRFEALTARIPNQGQYGQSNPYGQYGWESISQRQAQIEARLNTALRNRALSNWQAARLRADLSALVRLETQYSQGGITRAEQADLDRRFNALSAQIPGANAY
ncbi:MAG: hypothetical protein MH112_11230 [Phenylobacterium sp.]|uniref:hypothetical protein n=1 Tax=Phenylobacterium sp. TaxID=1871053 RepID=UPI0025E985C3|nr:hypothetical protein [Phenylobacterium sp.]MCG9916911.1 hypothetical protein [Phenylobacterium sp.]